MTTEPERMVTTGDDDLDEFADSVDDAAPIDGGRGVILGSWPERLTLVGATILVSAAGFQVLLSEASDGEGFGGWLVFFQNLLLGTTIVGAVVAAAGIVALVRGDHRS